MAYEALFSEIKSLPDDLVYQVQEYVIFLKTRATNKTVTVKRQEPMRKGGTLAGKLKYIADDFNATPEGFEGYM